MSSKVDSNVLAQIIQESLRFYVSKLYFYSTNKNLYNKSAMQHIVSLIYDMKV